MKKRTLGRSGLNVVPLAFGGNVFGWTADESMSFRLLDRFVDAGFNFIDTADIYSRWVPGAKGGESETIIGRWLKRSGQRDKVVIATKVGMDMGSAGKGLSPDHIRSAIEASLSRLQTDYIDLYQSHIDDPTTSLEETLSTFHELLVQGKVRSIGASNYHASRLAEALNLSRRLDLPRYETLQPHYNLCERAAYEKELEALCQQEELGVIPYFSLARGFLTGKYRSEADLSQSPRGSGVKQYLNPRGQRILKALDEIALDRKSKPASVAIAWLMARPSITAPIASATNMQQLEDLMAAAHLDLSPDVIHQLNEASIE